MALRVRQRPHSLALCSQLEGDQAHDLGPRTATQAGGPASLEQLGPPPNSRSPPASPDPPTPFLPPCDLWICSILPPTHWSLPPNAAFLALISMATLTTPAQDHYTQLT